MLTNDPLVARSGLTLSKVFGLIFMVVILTSDVRTTLNVFNDEAKWAKTRTNTFLTD